ncbi:MAG: hypothetical protein ACI4V7_07910 [Succinivibrionaceae bacterium]
MISDIADYIVKSNEDICYYKDNLLNLENKIKTHYNNVKQEIEELKYRYRYDEDVQVLIKKYEILLRMSNLVSYVEGYKTR